MPAPESVVNDEVRRQVLLEGVKAGTAKKFEKHLKRIEKGIRARLSAEGITIRNKTRLAALLADTRRITTDNLDSWLEELVAELDEVAITEGSLEASLLEKTLPEFEAVLPAPAQLITAFQQNALSVRGKSQGLPLTPFLNQYDKDQIALIEGIISQGFAEGKTIGEITQAMRGTKAANFQDGVLAKVDKNTTIMVRTAVQNASAQAKQATWQANSDVIDGIEWVSTLDSGTTTQCRTLDGQVFPIDSGPRPPIHYGCRSTTAPVVDPSLDFLKEGAKRPAVGEKADGDTTIGQVRADTTYYSWLKNQPAQFQDKVLGGTRGKLLRSGGLNADQFARLQLNSNFQPLTLAEMAEEAPEAFRQANLLNEDGTVKRVKKNVQPN